jgi:putative nucleotidyltransferase with HDIG domain
MRSTAEVAREISSLATLPAMYYRLTEAANSPRTSLAEVGRIIGEDAALTSRILRLVNSAAFGSGFTVESVPQALSLLGLAEMLDLALATTVLRVFPRIPATQATMESFWRHSIACAVAARAFGELRKVNPSRCFVGGLLHDIGRLALYLHEPGGMREAGAAARAGGHLLHDAERAILGFDHADLGRELLVLWRLPPPVQEMVACHHAPETASACRAETTLVHLADAVVNALELGSSGQTAVPPVHPTAWEGFELDALELQLLLVDIERRYADAVQVMLLLDR